MGTWSNDEKIRFLKRLQEYPKNDRGMIKNWGHFSIGTYHNGIGRDGSQCKDFYWRLVEQGQIEGITMSMRSRVVNTRKRKSEGSEEYTPPKNKRKTSVKKLVGTNHEEDESEKQHENHNKQNGNCTYQQCL